MPKSWFRPLVGALGLAAAVALLPTQPPELAAAELAEGALGKTFTADIEFLQKGLTKEPTKRDIGPLKAVAMLVAWNAQSKAEGAKADDMIALRNEATKIVGLIHKKDYAGARKAAAELEKLKADPKADKKPVKLEELPGIDLDAIMSTFKSGTAGGLNLEKDINAQAKKPDAAITAVLGTRVATIGEYTLLMAPAEAVGAKKKDWDDWSKEMTKLGKELAEESEKGAKADNKVLTKKLNGLSANCVACHKVFRN